MKLTKAQPGECTQNLCRHFCRPLLSPLVPSTVFVSFYSMDSFHLYFFACQRLSLARVPPTKVVFLSKGPGTSSCCLASFFPRPPLLFFPRLVSVSSPLFSLLLSSSQWDYAKREVPWRFAVDFKAISCSAPAFFSSYLCTNTHTRTPVTHTPHHLICGIFSPAHAECVISSAWCPPLEK